MNKSNSFFFDGGPALPPPSNSLDSSGGCGISFPISYPSFGAIRCPQR